MNMVALVGNLATEPELRHAEGGKERCTFRIAVSRAGGTDADFFTVVTWGRQAQVCKDYLSIGRRVAVEGRLSHFEWKDESDGSRRSRVEVVARHVGMLGGGKRREQPAQVEDAAADPAPIPAFALS